MDKNNNKFYICIEADNCNHKTCIHKVKHKSIKSEDPKYTNCVEGAFCYYKNISVHCKEA